MTGAPDDLFAGKEAIRPIFTRLASIVEELGPDVAIAAGPDQIVFARGREFALLEAATPQRLDVGLVLPGAAEGDRLRPAGSSRAGRVTHRVSLAHEDEIDAELITWLRDAYDAASK